MGQKEHFLFLYLATGGGHIGAARALAEEVRRRHSEGDVRISIVDGIKEGEAFQRGLVEDGFRFTAVEYPVLWAGLYEWSRLRVVMDLQTRLMCKYSVPYFEELIPRLKPTRIIVFHFLLVRPLRWAYRRLGYRLPSLTIITDPFTCHPMWFYQQFMPVACYTQKLQAYASRRYGIDPGTLHVKNPIINPRYDRPMTRAEVAEAKRAGGFHPLRRLILMVGGGEGLPRGERYLAEMRRLNPDADIAFVAGKNDELRDAACAVARQAHGAPLPAALPQQVDHTVDHPVIVPGAQIFADGGAVTVVYGFVNFLYELMNMADVIVTKGGPASVLEAAKLEKPIMIAYYFYGQERGNVDFVVKNGLGKYTQTPRASAEAVRDLFADPAAIPALERNYEKVRLTNGTPEFADYIFNFEKESPDSPRLLHG